ncbi:hypothetical protein U1Q18_041786 [Sarracenia purpurea var. burkii]
MQSCLEEDAIDVEYDYVAVNPDEKTANEVHQPMESDHGEEYVGNDNTEESSVVGKMELQIRELKEMLTLRDDQIISSTTVNDVPREEIFDLQCQLNEKDVDDITDTEK